MAGSETEGGNDLAVPDYSSDDMGLDPNYTQDQIQRIQMQDDPQPGAVEPARQGPQPEVPDPQNKKRSRQNLRAPVWKHFNRGEIKADGTYDAICKYCEEKYEMGKQRGTNSMKHHLKKKCKKIPASMRRKPDCFQKLLQMGNLQGEAVPAVWEFDQERCRKSFAKMVIAHEYPFNCATHHYLKSFLRDLQPQFQLKSRNTVRADCMKIYQEEKLSLYEFFNKLESKVSLTGDMWTNSKGDRGFMALTCHFIDDNWTLKKRIINFAYVPSPHTGKHIAETIYHRLLEWNLDKKLTCITLDNASANDVAARELLATSLKDTLAVQGSIFHQRCGCHILNLIVQDGLEVLSDDIKKIRETMKYICHSQARMEKFNLVASQVRAPKKKPAWDVPTRWNSTYLMLKLAVELKPALQRYAALDNNFDYSLEDDEWEAMRVLAEHLKVFYDVTLKLSGTKYPTLNMFFPEFCEVLLAIKNMASSQYPFVVKMGREMLKKWDKYWTSGNSLLAIACILDPRCKVAVVKYYLDKMYPNESDCLVEKLVSCLKTLFKEYLEEHSKSIQSQSQMQAGSSTQAGRQTGSSSEVTDTRAGLKDFMRGLKEAAPVKTDVEQYLSDPHDATNLEDQFDILNWWKVNAPKYPILARLARDILAVPISTVPSESAFSTGGRTLSKVRSSLDDESIEALICAQDWLRAIVTENGQGVGDPLWSIDEAND